MKGTVSTLSFVSLWFALSLSLSLSPSLSPSFLPAIYGLETSYLRIFYEKKVWAISGERGREESGKLASVKRRRTGQRERGKGQELTSEIVWTLLAVYFCELKAVEAQKAGGNWSKLVYLHASFLSSPLLSSLSSVFVPQFYRC